MKCISFLHDFPNTFKYPHFNKPVSKSQPKKLSFEGSKFSFVFNCPLSFTFSFFFFLKLPFLNDQLIVFFLKIIRTT